MPDTIPSRYKAVIVYEHTCLVCGHQWESQNEVPRQCPSCWSRKWNRRDGGAPKTEPHDGQE